MEKTIPIIIVTYNKLEQFTIPCIESIIKNTKQPYKVVLVDNASTDNTAETIKSKYKMIDVISCDYNNGWAVGNMIGINHVNENYSYDYICLLNSDTLVSNNWLTKLKSILEKNKRASSIIPTEKIYENNLFKKIYVGYLSKSNLVRTIISCTPLKHFRGKGISMPSETKPKIDEAFDNSIREISEINLKLEKKYANKVEKSTHIKSGYCLLLKKNILNEYVHYLENFDTLFPSKSIGYWDNISYQKNTQHLVSKGTYVYHYRGGSGGYFV